MCASLLQAAEKGPSAAKAFLGGGHAQLPLSNSIGQADRGRPNLPQDCTGKAHARGASTGGQEEIGRKRELLENPRMGLQHN